LPLHFLLSFPQGTCFFRCRCLFSSTHPKFVILSVAQRSRRTRHPACITDTARTVQPRKRTCFSRPRKTTNLSAGPNFGQAINRRAGGRAGGSYLLKPPPNGVPHISILRCGKGAQAALHVFGQSNWTRSQLYPYHLSTSDDGWTRPIHHALGSVPAYTDSDACTTVSRSSSYR